MKSWEWQKGNPDEKGKGGDRGGCEGVETLENRETTENKRGFKEGLDDVTWRMGGMAGGGGGGEIGRI